MDRDGCPPRQAGAFIFDLDGTLVDSGLDLVISANHVRRRFGLPELAPAVILSYVGDGAPLLVRRLLSRPERADRPSRPPDEASALAGVEAFRAHYAAHCLDHTVLFPGVRETLASFAALPLAVATNKPAALTRRILDGLGLAGGFRRVVCADETPRRKPDPAHLAACLLGLDVSPARVVMVGDSCNDVQAARGLGACAVAVTYGLTPPDVLREAGPDLLIDRFDRLAALFAPDGKG